jgi:hypothetical protein
MHAGFNWTEAGEDTVIMGEDDNSLRVAKLDEERYACGLLYFNQHERWFPDSTHHSNSSNDTWVVHNNWIVSHEAKIYRFKEHMMWAVDNGTHQYDLFLRRL